MVKKNYQISYCIITDGNEPKKLRALLSSIKLETPVMLNHEVIVAGDLPKGEFVIDDWLPMEDAAGRGQLGKMRNAACRRAKGQIIIVLDDDMRLMAGFWGGLLDCIDTNPWDVVAPNILNPDGSRFWGWATCIDGVSRLKPWDEPDEGQNYLTGGACIMKRAVFDKVQWEDALGFYQGEDVIFSAKLHRAGYFLLPAPRCKILHDANYTQRGDGVFRI